MLQLAEQAELRRKDPRAATKNIKELFDEDEALLSGKSAPGEVEGYSERRTPEGETLSIRLSELITRLESSRQETHGPQGSTVHETAAFESIETRTEMKLTYRASTPIEGLQRRSRTEAETDRYYFEFSDPTTFKITDKWTGRATTIWGDPHVDTDDQEGNANGEFSDLKDSNRHTTLQLMDGTRVTFTALDNGVIEMADIYKGSQHLRGYGGAYPQLSAENSQFSGAVDSQPGSLVPLGDVVSAGGDGNDWYAGGRLLWGRTTGPVVNHRPAYTLELEFKQTVIQQSVTMTRSVQA
jgi:hypothetical protein